MLIYLKCGKSSSRRERLEGEIKVIAYYSLISLVISLIVFLTS